MLVTPGNSVSGFAEAVSSVMNRMKAGYKEDVLMGVERAIVVKLLSSYVIIGNEDFPLIQCARTNKEGNCYITINPLLTKKIKTK